MSELEIIGVPQSNFVRTVRVACEEKRVPYRLTPGRPRSPEVNAIHPLGKIPVELRTYVGVCNRAVAETGHLVGNEFSYADMNLLPVLAYLRECPESAEALNDAKELAQYLDRHGECASFKATVPPPFSDLRQPAAAARPGKP